MKVVIIFVCAVYILTGCASSIPQIRVMPVSENATLYYISPTVWRSSGNRNTTVKLDISYRSENNNPVICNISFYNTAKTPEFVSDIVFIAGDKEYPLENIAILFIEPQRNELRVTSTIPITALMELFSENIFSLRANVDGSVYQYTPPKIFYSYRDQFVKHISIYLTMDTRSTKTLSDTSPEALLSVMRNSGDFLPVSLREMAISNATDDVLLKKQVQWGWRMQ